MTVFNSLPVKRNCRALLAAAVIVALAARGFIPAGYMPDMQQTGDGEAAAITLCHGMDDMDMAGMQMPDNQTATDKSDGAQKFQGHTPCPFSVNAVFAAADNTAQFSVPLAIYFILTIFAAFVLAQNRRFGNAAPRAPPLFA